MKPGELRTFMMVNVAAQRARQLMQGAAPIVRSASRKPAAIAIREVEAGLVPYYTPEDLPSPLEDDGDDAVGASAEEPSLAEGADGEETV